MVVKSQRVLIPYTVDKELPGLWIIPPGVKDDRDR